MGLLAEKALLMPIEALTRDEVEKLVEEKVKKPTTGATRRRKSSGGRHSTTTHFIKEAPGDHHQETEWDISIAYCWWSLRASFSNP